ncbi:MAG: PQQ-like beta-propeller repeat protein [Phycisphaerae bacterium]|nr:PQQ-like beta-propeller repeat protein [Phycisphaerae bacterium]
MHRAASFVRGAAIACSTVLLTSAASAASDAVDDWPMFRGNSQLNGVASTTLPQRLELLWKFVTEGREPVTSSAAIVGDSVYVGCENGNLYCLRLANGSLKWKYATSESAAIKSSPTVVGESVLFGDELGRMHCIRMSDGSKRWIFDTGTEIVSSPNPSGDRVVFGSYDGLVYCISLADGSPLWKFTTEAQVHSTLGISDGCVVVGGCDGRLRVLKLADGSELREADVGAQTASSTALWGDHAYFGTLGNRVLCIDWKTARQVWVYENPDRSFPFHSSAAVTSDLVVIGGRDKFVHALDRETGVSRWSFRTQGRVDSSPLIVVEDPIDRRLPTSRPAVGESDRKGGSIGLRDRVFVGSSDGRLYALSLRTGESVWEYDTGSAISASPAAGRGHLVIGDEDGTVYCFGRKVR